MAERRELTFAGLDEVMPEVERLLGGHVMVGCWSLGQVCNHLATAVTLMLDGGLDPVSAPLPEAVRRRFFRRRRFPGGVKAPNPALLPGPDLDGRAEAEAL